jgi:hypothetical protein
MIFWYLQLKAAPAAQGSTGSSRQHRRLKAAPTAQGSTNNLMKKFCIFGHKR